MSYNSNLGNLGPPMTGSPAMGPPGGNTRPGPCMPGVDEEYLEPTSTTPPVDQGWQQRREGYKPRAHISQLDSGVADVDGLHLMVDSNMNGIGPSRTSDPSLPPSIADRERMPRPNSLAVKGHEYEELPSSRYQPRYGYQEMDDNSGSGSSGGPGRPLPPPMLNKLKSNLPEGNSNDSLCRPLSGTSSNGGTDRISNTYRKRENPLYDEGEPDELELKPRKTSDMFGCPCSGFLMVAAVALVALILAILLFTGAVRQKQEVSFSPETAALVDKMNHTSLLAALAKMERIESQYYTLLQKFTQLNYSMNQELTAMKEGARASNGTMSHKIMRVEVDFTDRLNRFETALSSQIDDVSKMEGPQGPRGLAGPSGAGNLTGCSYIPKRRGTAVSTTSTDTDWWPETLDDHRNWVMMGVECSTTGGTSSLLLTRTSTSSSISGVPQFSCTCEGNDGSSTSRFCILNIWRCPRIS